MVSPVSRIYSAVANEWLLYSFALSDSAALKKEGGEGMPQEIIIGAPWVEASVSGQLVATSWDRTLITSCHPFPSLCSAEILDVSSKLDV